MVIMIDWCAHLLRMKLKVLECCHFRVPYAPLSCLPYAIYMDAALWSCKCICSTSIIGSSYSLQVFLDWGILNVDKNPVSWNIVLVSCLSRRTHFRSCLLAVCLPTYHASKLIVVECDYGGYGLDRSKPWMTIQVRSLFFITHDRESETRHEIWNVNI